MSNYNNNDEEDEYGMGRPPSEPPLTPPPHITTPVPTRPPAPSYSPSPAPSYSPAPAPSTAPSYSSGASMGASNQQFQQKINELQTQVGQLQGTLSAKENQINQLNSQLNSVQSSIQGYQNQIGQLNNEKGQLQAQIPELQNQVGQLQQQNSMLAGQIGPLQAQIAKLQEELQYKSRRIEELKEPKPVMTSSLAQGSQNSGFGGSAFGGTSFPATATSTPSPVLDPSGAAGSIGATPDMGAQSGASGRRICVNCGATGNQIKEIEDRTRIISYIPKTIYAKKLVCTKCGYEF